ncbi:MAG TPA: TlpA disulfide reductase family protein [Ignavibacteriaceae bacterium]|jgi:cytochrome c biogenesis protein CcmG/thiol:disulfide interchange protein DsbE|nr:TlpA disulfide reductase family protein [Ignavibacteriaceae bacterium]
MKKLIVLPLFILFAVNLFAQAEEDQTGRSAPEFKLENVDGNYVSLKDELGNGPILISFWATWCKPCIEEMTKYKSIYEDYKDKGFKVLAVSVDDERTVAKVKPFVRSKNYPFLVLLDTNSEVARKYYAQNVPYSVLLDKDGNIVYTHLGYMKGDELKMKNKIDELVNK